MVTNVVDAEVARQRALLGAAVRYGRPDADERRAALREAVLAKHIQEAVAAAPPFKPEQIERLRSLLPDPNEA